MAEAGRKTNTKALTTCALLAALALIFSYLEFLLPINAGLPGIKLGLANIAVLAALYQLGPGYALFVNLARIALAALLFGNMFSALYLAQIARAALITSTPGLFAYFPVLLASGMAAGIFNGIVCTLVLRKISR